jgi:hypothetical protein
MTRFVDRRKLNPDSVSSTRRSAVRRPVNTRLPWLSVAESKQMDEKRSRIMEILMVPAFLVFWFMLQIWVLPKLGVPT